MNPDSNDNAIDVIDSHTGGEPTRVVVHGGPACRSPDPAGIRNELAASYDRFRRAVVCEPRGSDVLVGALLTDPHRQGSTAGVVFFNNVGYLRMCGHGAIGVAVTLAHLGRIGPGRHALDTPAGTVAMTLHDAHRVSIENVASYRHRRDVAVRVPGIGDIRGDIAWGGNWFFLVRDHDQRVSRDNVPALTEWTSRLREALDESDLRGADGELIDHIELFGPPRDPARADGRNFVLCPGRVHDRSPCGTGTSAKLACLIEDGVLRPGDTWRQESISGSIFTASAVRVGGQLVPTITGEAWITGETRLHIDPDDPFGHGIPAGDD